MLTHSSSFVKDGSCVTSLMEFAIKNNEVLATYPLASENKCTPNYMSIPGIKGEYESVQFHIHLSSEHKVSTIYR
jgi:carbonic anhydrase